MIPKDKRLGKFYDHGAQTDIHPEVMAISRSANGGASFSDPIIFLPQNGNEALNAPLGMHLTDHNTLVTSYTMFYMDSIPMSVLSHLDPGIGNEIVGKIEVLVSKDGGHFASSSWVPILMIW